MIVAEYTVPADANGESTDRGAPEGRPATLADGTRVKYLLPHVANRPPQYSPRLPRTDLNQHGTALADPLQRFR